MRNQYVPYSLSLSHVCGENHKEEKIPNPSYGLNPRAIIDWHVNTFSVFNDKNTYFYLKWFYDFTKNYKCTMEFRTQEAHFVYLGEYALHLKCYLPKSSRNPIAEDFQSRSLKNHSYAFPNLATHVYKTNRIIFSGKAEPSAKFAVLFSKDSD